MSPGRLVNCTWLHANVHCLSLFAFLSFRLVFVGISGCAAVNAAPSSAGLGGGFLLFTFSEFLEALIQFACNQHLKAVDGFENDGIADTLLTAEHVQKATMSLVENSILKKVVRDDIKGFRQALRTSSKLGSALQRAEPLLRLVHERYSLRGEGPPENIQVQMDDKGGYGLPLSRFTEMVWESGLIGRELSRNAAKAAFVNALNIGDAVAGITEFGEAVVRLAHGLQPMTREQRVGAPPPPPKIKFERWTQHPTAPLPPPLLRKEVDGMVFEEAAEEDAPGETTPDGKEVKKEAATKRGGKAKSKAKAKAKALSEPAQEDPAVWPAAAFGPCSICSVLLVFHML